MKLFDGSGGYGAGEQVRDFISVEDVVRVNLFFLDHPRVSGIFNVGTGRAQTFNDVARATVNALRSARGEKAMTLDELREAKAIEYIAFPPQLVGKYQSYTQADMGALRAAGYARKIPRRGGGRGPLREGALRRVQGMSMRTLLLLCAAALARILRVRGSRRGARTGCRNSGAREGGARRGVHHRVAERGFRRRRPARAPGARPAGPAACTPIRTRSVSRRSRRARGRRAQLLRRGGRARSRGRT